LYRRKPRLQGVSGFFVSVDPGFSNHFPTDRRTGVRAASGSHAVNCNNAFISLYAMDIRPPSPEQQVIDHATIPRRLVPDATLQLILEDIASGNHVRGACELAGVGKSSFYAWLAEDHDLAERYGEALRQQTTSRYNAK
jgi:hypothetical protein